jgi:hypothetical protein
MKTLLQFIINRFYSVHETILWFLQQLLAIKNNKLTLSKFIRTLLLLLIYKLPKFLLWLSTSRLFKMSNILFTVINTILIFSVIIYHGSITSIYSAYQATYAWAALALNLDNIPAAALYLINLYNKCFTAVIEFIKSITFESPADNASKIEDKPIDSIDEAELSSSETELEPLQVQSNSAYGKPAAEHYTKTEIVLYSLFGVFTLFSIGIIFCLLFGYYPFDPENLKDLIRDFINDKCGINIPLSEKEEGRLRNLEIDRQLSETEVLDTFGPQESFRSIVPAVGESAAPASSVWEDVKPSAAPAPDSLAPELLGSEDPYKTGFNDFFVDDPFSGGTIASSPSDSSSSSGGTITPSAGPTLAVPSSIGCSRFAGTYKIKTVNFKNLNTPVLIDKRSYSTVKFNRNRIKLGDYLALYLKWNNEPENIFGENILLTNELISHLIKTFWKKRVIYLNEGYAMYFMFKVKYGNHPTTDYATVNKMFTIYNSSEDNLNQLIKELTSALNGLNESYRSSIIIRSIICYKILPLTWVNESPAKNLTVIKELGTSKNVEKLFQSFELPANMNYNT